MENSGMSNYKLMGLHYMGILVHMCILPVNFG